jgi:hypothetical protein
MNTPLGGCVTPSYTLSPTHSAQGVRKKGRPAKYDRSCRRERDVMGRYKGFVSRTYEDGETDSCSWILQLLDSADLSRDFIESQPLQPCHPPTLLPLLTNNNSLPVQEEHRRPPTPARTHSDLCAFCLGAPTGLARCTCNTPQQCAYCLGAPTGKQSCSCKKVHTHTHTHTHERERERETTDTDLDFDFFRNLFEGRRMVGATSAVGDQEFCNQQ